jgi:hypothetical protein
MEKIVVDHGSKRAIFQSLLIVLLVACTPRTPAQPFSVGPLLDEARFDSTLDWEAYQDAGIGVEGRVVDGVYRIDVTDGGFIWALHDHIEGDVIVEVETQQLSDYPDNAYGVMCRAAPSANGNGYYFFISSDGYYTIRRGVGREVSDLIPFTFHESIRRGKDFNRLRVVCLGDYLALFVNGVLVGEVRDDRYRAGVVGLTAAVPDDGDVSILFDNVLIFTALPG